MPSLIDPRHSLTLVVALCVVAGCGPSDAPSDSAKGPAPEAAADAPRAAADAPKAAADAPKATADTPKATADTPKAAADAQARAAGPIATDKATIEAWFDAYCPSGGSNYLAVPAEARIPVADIPFDIDKSVVFGPELSVMPRGLVSQAAVYDPSVTPRPWKATGRSDAAGRAADRDSSAIKPSPFARRAMRVMIDARVPAWRAYDVLSGLSRKGKVEVLVASTQAPAKPAEPDATLMSTLRKEMAEVPMATDRQRWLVGINKANVAACPAIGPVYASVGEVPASEKCAHLTRGLTRTVPSCPPETVRSIMAVHSLLHNGQPFAFAQPWTQPGGAPVWAEKETPWGEVAPSALGLTGQ